MADANANIRIDVDTSEALAQIKALQRQISIFHTSMSQSGKAAASQSAKMQANLVNSINATKGFTAGMVNIESSTESFTRSLEKNKFSMGQYFNYAGASTKTFGKLFKTEFETIGKVARERVKDLQTQYIKMGRGANGALQAIKIRPTTLDMKDLGTQTAMAAQKQQLFNQLVKQGSTNLLNWGKNTQWAGRQLMVGFTIPLTIFGGIAAKEFMKLEEQAVRFKRVYGDMFTTDKETQKALSDIRELAKEFTKFGVSVEDTIDLAASVAQMGGMGADLTNQVTQATRLAVLGGIDQKEALETTISLTNAFGLATDQLAEKVAFLNAAENQTILAIEDFNTAIPLSGSVVRQLGGDVEDLAVLLTAMREGGINASQAGNALKSSLGRLIAPSRNAKETLGKFGIDVLGIVEANAGNLMGTINTLAVSLNNLDPLSRARSIEALFGKFQFARMSTLFSNIIREGSQASKVLELTTNSAEELAIIAERELGRVSESSMYKFKKSLEEIQAALAPVGEAFLKLATPLVEFGTKVLDQFNKLSDGTKQFIVGAVAIGGVVAPAVIMVIGLIANAIANTIKFGLLIKQSLGGATGSSKLLTDQMSYMNSEQIEAAAVAASLDQVHTKLRQTFTSEAAAVNALTAAYTRAIAKQNQMMMATTGKAPRGGKKPPGYADGVISVPGPRGAGDIVPAMLSPGEAVIPSGIAQKYAPLIEAMFRNKIPGYKKGRLPDPAYGGEGLTKRVAEYLRDNGMLHPAAPRAAAPVPAYGGEGLTKKVAEYLRDNGMLHPAAPRAAAPSAVLPKLHRSHLQAPLDPNDPKVRAQILKLAPNYDQMDPSLKASAQFSGSLVAETSPVLNQKLKSASGVKANEFGSIWDSIDDKLLSSAVAGGLDPKNPAARKALKEIEQQVGRKAVELAKNAGTAVTDGVLTQATDAVLMDSKKAKGMSSQVASQLESRKKVIGDVRGRFTKAQYQENLASGKMALKGQQIVDPTTGLVLGDRRESRSGKNPTGYKQKTQQVSKFGGYAKQPLMAKVNDPKRALLINQTAAEDTRAYNKASEAAMKKSPKSDKYLQSRKRNSPHKQAALDGKADAAAYNKAAAKESQKQQKTSGGIAAGVKGVGAKLKPMVGRLAVGAGAASGIAMAASMIPGEIGEQAQKLIMPLMGLGMVLPLLTSGVGLAVVALGALAAGVIWTRMSFDKLQTESMALAESLGGGSRALERFGKASGKVSAGEIMDKRRGSSLGVFQIQPGKDTFGNTFMGSEAGDEMRTSIKQSLSQNGAPATQKMVTSQLATAVASGVLDAAQARSIIASLAAELRDYSFGIEVNARLTELLGPNGENLIKDPLGIRLEILDEGQKQLEASFTSLGDTAAMTTKDWLLGTAGVMGGLVAGGIAGAIGGAKVGAALGTVFGPKGTAVGTLIGGIVGGVGGAISGGILGGKERSDRIATSSGASVALQKIAIQQQQEMVDSLELEYEQRIENARAAGDLAKVEELTNQRILDRKALLEKNQQLIDQIRTGYSDAPPELRAALDTGVDKAMSSAYKGTALEDVVPQTKDIIEQNVQDKELQYILKMQVASEEIGPIQMIDFLTTFGKGTVEQDAVINMIGKMGGAFTSQTMGLVKLLDGNKDLQSDVLLNITSAKSPEEANSLLEFYQRLSQTDSVLEREAKFKFIIENPEAAAELQSKLENLNNFSGEITMDVVANILGADAVDALSKDLDYYNGLNDQMKKIYLQTLVTTISTVSPDDPALANWLGGAGSAHRNSPPGEQLVAYANYNAGVVSKIAMDTTGVQPDSEEPSGPSGGPKASVFDELTKKIRDFRKETFKAQLGWDAATNALNKLFDGGKKGLSVFGGLSNKLRELGAGEGIIQMIVGMDPDEYEKRKKELFKFDKDGNIVGTTNKFKSLAAAVNEVALGEYINSQQSFITNTKNQIGAIAILTANGMSLAAAYEAVQDEAMAAALMMGQTKKEIEEILRITGIARQLRDDMQKQQERVNIGESVKKTNEEFRDQINILNMLAKSQGKYNDDQIKAIMGDRNLQKLLLDPSIDPKALEERLRQAAQQANLELRIKVSTAEGKKQLFDELMGDINTQFSNKEQEIEIDFRLATEADSDIVREAENKIAAIQYQVDDYEAQLKGIGDQEDAINKRYDARYEALDKVKEAQEAVTRASKAQLDIADALSRGDIAAAARAQQELRDQQAQASAEQQRTQLERAQKAELSNVRSKSGQSRVQLEDLIKSKQDEIFEIQEDELEPAQERIRIAEYGKAVAIDNLTIAGKTRDEWDKISNATALATVNAEEFAKTIERALALYEYFVNGRPLDLNLFGQEELDQLVSDGLVNPEDIVRAQDPEEILSPEIVKRINLGESVGDDGLTEKQIAAKNLLEIGSLKSQLNDPAKAAAASKELAKKAGIIDSNGNMTVTADRAEAILKDQERKASANYARLVGSTNPDRLDAAYQRDISSQGLSTNVGKNTPAQQVASNYQARIVADKKGTPALSTTAQNIVAGTGSKALNDPLGISKIVNSVVSFFNPPKPAAKPAPTLTGLALRNALRMNSGGAVPYSVGGKVKGYPMGGLIPYKANGGFFKSLGSDTVPAMLTPGEFVVRRPAVRGFGIDNLEKINNGEYSGGSVYNYNLAVNVKSDSDPERIARTVIQQIKRIDSQKVRGNRI